MTEITLKDFEKVGPWEIFASGVDNFEGNVNHWVAVKSRGGFMDWALYYMPQERGFTYHDARYFEKRIAEWGDKLHNPTLIKKLVNCTDEVLTLYRQ